MVKYVINIMVLIIVFLMVTWTDIKSYRISNKLCFYLLAYSLVLMLLNQITPLHFVYAAVVSTPLFLVHMMSRHIGLGDVKLIFVLVSMIGINHGIKAMCIAFILAGVYGCVVLYFEGYRPQRKIAYGPFIAFGFLLSYIMN